MNNSIFDVIIIGAGQAGLSASYYVTKAGLRHIVFERGKTGESWRTQRWHSFKLNSPNHLNLLPGGSLKGHHPDTFCSHTEFVSLLEDYVADHQLPVREQTTVLSVERMETLSQFKITVLQNNSTREYRSRQIIIASGMQSERKIPSFAHTVSAHIKQLHASEYRNASQLPDGAVLVVGSAQSGCQIAEDLLEQGRKVYLSTSMVGRIPRRYRGKDIMDWLLMIGFFDMKTEDVTDPHEFAMKAPQMSGTGGEQGHTISLRALSQRGAVIVGKMEKASGSSVFFQANAWQHVQFADELSGKIKSIIDGFIQQNGLDVEPAAIDTADMPDTDGSCASSITSLNLKEHRIASVIWATGFCGKFNYIKLPVFNQDGTPKHRNGISDVEGLYFLGLPWLRTRKSALINGIQEDAAFICEKVINRSLAKSVVLF